MNKICAKCSNDFIGKTSRSKFCSLCKYEFCHKKCKNCGKIFDSILGRKVFCSKKCNCDSEERKRKFRIAVKGKPRSSMRGKNHYRWKDGESSSERHNAMGRVEYRSWRQTVFYRDKFKCQLCEKIGGSLNAHHIFGWSHYPEFRYNIVNGLTLCKDCHNIIHNRKTKIFLVGTIFDEQLDMIISLDDKRKLISKAPQFLRDIFQNY